jgi:hypothetical protein
VRECLCNANHAPATCPAPGFPANFLGRPDMYTDQILRMSLGGATLRPQGMIFALF